MPLTLADIPATAATFLDANVFVYHFAPHPVLQSACQQLLERFAGVLAVSVQNFFRGWSAVVGGW